MLHSLDGSRMMAPTKYVALTTWGPGRATPNCSALWELYYVSFWLGCILWLDNERTLVSKWMKPFKTTLVGSVSCLLCHSQAPDI